MRTLVLLLAVGAAGCIPTSIPSTPAPSLDEVAAELGVPRLLTLRLREGTFDGTACDLRVYTFDETGLTFDTVEFPGQRDAGLAVTSDAVGPFAVGQTVEVRVEGTACAPRLRYGSRPVEGEGQLRIVSIQDGQVSGALVADLLPAGGAAARAGRSVRVLGTFTLAPPKSTVSE